MGIHWRTRILGPNVSALAKAAWEQGEWANPAPTPKPEKQEGAIGGSTASFLIESYCGYGERSGVSDGALQYVRVPVRYSQRRV